MFASRVTKDLALPSDPSVIVTIRKLSWLQRQSAQKKSQQDSAKSLIAMGGAAFMKEWQALSTDETKKDEVAATYTDPMTTHDLETVLVCGVKGWTASEPVTRETLTDLDLPDAEFLAREILALSLPTEAQEKEA